MKILFFSFLFVLLVQMGFSQSFKAGFHFGMTATQVTGDTYSGYKKLGIFAGISVNHPIDEKSSLQMEMNYIQKGSRRNVDSLSTDPSYLMRLQYLEIPILYKKSFRKNFGYEFGISFGYLIKAAEYDDTYLISINYRLPFKKYEVAGIAGINYKINEKWRFSFRYSYSILSIRPQVDGYSRFMNGGQYNDVLCTSLQYSF
jgi:hypothetical protein